MPVWLLNLKMKFNFIFSCVVALLVVEIHLLAVLETAQRCKTQVVVKTSRDWSIIALHWFVIDIFVLGKRLLKVSSPFT